jgi:hypothetical protein
VLPHMHPMMIAHVKIFTFILQLIPKGMRLQDFTSWVVRGTELVAAFVSNADLLRRSRR